MNPLLNFLLCVSLSFGVFVAKFCHEDPNEIRCILIYKTQSFGHDLTSQSKGLLK